MRGRHSEIIAKGDRIIKRFPHRYEYNFWKEAGFLSLLQPYNFVPRLYSVRPEMLEIEMEFVRGVEIGESIKSLEKYHLERILDICRELDRLGIQKEEMNHPDRHIIISDRIVFIDFERSVIKFRPSNLTQFAVYLNSRLKLFKKDELRELLRNYKKKFDDREYESLKIAIIERFELKS